MTAGVPAFSSAGTATHQHTSTAIADPLYSYKSHCRYSFCRLYHLSKNGGAAWPRGQSVSHPNIGPGLSAGEFPEYVGMTRSLKNLQTGWVCVTVWHQQLARRATALGAWLFISLLCNRIIQAIEHLPSATPGLYDAKAGQMVSSLWRSHLWPIFRDGWLDVRTPGTKDHYEFSGFEFRLLLYWPNCARSEGVEPRPEVKTMEEGPAFMTHWKQLTMFPGAQWRWQQKRAQIKNNKCYKDETAFNQNDVTESPLW